MSHTFTLTADAAPKNVDLQIDAPKNSIWLGGLSGLNRGSVASRRPRLPTINGKKIGFSRKFYLTAGRHRAALTGCQHSIYPLLMGVK